MSVICQLRVYVSKEVRIRGYFSKPEIKQFVKPCTGRLKASLVTYRQTDRRTTTPSAMLSGWGTGTVLRDDRPRWQSDCAMCTVMEAGGGLMPIVRIAHERSKQN